MANPTPAVAVSWQRWTRLAVEAIVAALILSAPAWADGLTTIPPR